jgi:hypothetical protein
MKQALIEFSGYGIDSYKLSCDIISLQLIFELREKNIPLLLSIDELQEILWLPVRLQESNKIKHLIARYLNEVVKL